MKIGFDKKSFINIIAELLVYRATLVAVSKQQPNESIQELFKAGQTDFGENRVQELLQKQEVLPNDIRWHQIGHLQSNKIKQIIPFIHLIHSVDSIKLLQNIEKEAMRAGKKINVLLQVHIAKEDSKTGFSIDEIQQFFDQQSEKKFYHIDFRGLMGMATLSDDHKLIASEFDQLHKLYESFKINRPWFDTLSMGMSSDYKIALDHGSTMIRLGSAIFGPR